MNKKSKRYKLDVKDVVNGQIEFSYNKDTEGALAEAIKNNGNIDVELNEKDWLVLSIVKAIAGIKNNAANEIQLLQQLEDALHFILNYVAAVEFTPLKGNTKQFKYKIDFNEKAQEEEAFITNKVKEIIETPIVKQTIEYYIIKPKKEGYRPLSEPKQHKQSRSNMRGLAKIVGRDTNQATLFSLPLEELQHALEQAPKDKNGLPYKEKLSKKVGILSLQLMKEYQQVEKDEEGYIYIEDLGRLADELETNTKELKYYLLYLGGYQYPSVTYYAEEKEIGFQLAKRFDIEYRYNSKYKNREKKITAEIGKETIQLLINTPIKRIRIKPSQQFIKDIEGKSGRALGYINVNDNFIKLCLGLSDYAFKLLNYMATNKPDYKIGEDKLFKHLGLEEQVKKQGLPRIREKIVEAFEELLEQKHLKKYELSTNEKGLYSYSYTYTDKYINHQEANKSEIPAVEYVDFNDQSIDEETRKKAYKAWLINNKGATPAEAAKGVARKFSKAKS